MNPAALERARAGMYSTDRIRDWADRHREAGGACPLMEYFVPVHGQAAIQPSLRRNMHFTEHNLVGDQVFGEMNVILCRNVLIYFERPLQNRAVALPRQESRRRWLSLSGREGEPAADRARTSL